MDRLHGLGDKAKVILGSTSMYARPSKFLVYIIIFILTSYSRQLLLKIAVLALRVTDTFFLVTALSRMKNGRVVFKEKNIYNANFVIIFQKKKNLIF